MKPFRTLFAVITSATLFICSLSANAEIRAYKYSHSVKDEVKVQQHFGTGIWYFSFTSDKSKFYLTNENGISSTGQPDGIYQGSENGIHIYKGTTPFLGTSYFYFSSDFSRLNWDCIADNSSNYGPKIIRVLNYTPNPKTSNAPTQLY